MVPPESVVQWLNTHFPKPRVDPDWLQGCYEWLVNEQNISPVTAFPQFMDRVKEQLLESDLADSMLAGTGLRPGIKQATEKLQGAPLLVQIVRITEIGVSAFQLEQTRAAREERMRAGVGNIEGEEDGDVEVEGEGPMPKYPRGTLRFELTDGNTFIDAMEYRPLPQLTLGITELGYKMQLRGTRIHNGMAFLEPATVTLLGGRYSDLEEGQLKDFKRGLNTRLGRPLSPETADTADAPEPAALQAAAPVLLQATVPALAARAGRSPLREISPPLDMDLDQRHTDDVSMEPRRRIPIFPEVVDFTWPGKLERPIAALPSRTGRTSTGSNAEDDHEMGTRPTHAQRATLAFAGSKDIKPASASRYFDNTGRAAKNSALSKAARDHDIKVALQGNNLGFTLTPTPRQLVRTIPASPPALRPRESNGAFDFDLLDEFGVDENQAPPPRVDKGKAPDRHQPLFLPDTPPEKVQELFADSDDYAMDDDFPPDFRWDDVDEVEKAAAPVPGSSNIGRNTTPSSGAHSSHIMMGTRTEDRKPSLPITNSAGPAAPPRVLLDVIEIDDSDEEMEDKENQPVPARHVRQRMTSERPSFGAALALSQRTGRPVVQAVNPDDVIDLSDSE
ncbi:hypothetical protein HYPSUDRAFT_199138 [Hypholoma sublateritium FD-334 SS-4]|uniref:RecQ-mediated genome instability protein 1 n=1 Tax=Hypholoma sublateritium (strain FD-334 SS-4) TaxID=945553 RepID=A0A0D2PCV9_HYPSF|nr:hypothetical protein HYPSUDRAFT_199138 [Hypholoma sublateritium FD-334 SS-4]